MQSEFFQQAAKVLTVAELTRAIRGALETKFGNVWVQGEISNYKSHPSGHQYFTLKDQRAQIACVIFRNTLPPSSRPLSDGAQVQIYGNVSVFEARGQYQLSVQILQPRGVGLLQAKFEALKRKLEAEGLFESTRKRPLPKFPRRIGIVTSPSGAAIRDMLNVLQRRAPALQILINPVRVQGTGAATEIAVAIRELASPNDKWPPVELIVITRGGGSIEDLWEFNEEIVARAIADSPVPIVSAVGHEIDFTIADFVADLRAPTPSAAAELIVADVGDVLRRVDELAGCLARNVRTFLAGALEKLTRRSEKTLGRELQQRVRDAQQRIDVDAEALPRICRRAIADAQARLATRAQSLLSHSPAREIASRRDRATVAAQRLTMSTNRLLENARQCFRHVEGVLRVLGPEGTLRRGYSITMDSAGAVITRSHSVKAGMALRTRFTDGEIRSVAEN